MLPAQVPPNGMRTAKRFQRFHHVKIHRQFTDGGGFAAGMSALANHPNRKAGALAQLPRQPSRIFWCSMKHPAELKHHFHGLPTSAGDQFVIGNAVDLAADHGLAQVAADFGPGFWRPGSAWWALTMARRALGRIADLKIPEPTKNAVHAELHHHRSVRGWQCRQPAKLTTGSRPSWRGFHDQFVRERRFFSRKPSLLLRGAWSSGGCRPSRGAQGARLQPTSPVPASRWCGIIAAPAPKRAGLARLRAPHTNGILNACLFDVVFLIRSVSTSDSST